MTKIASKTALFLLSIGLTMPLNAAETSPKYFETIKTIEGIENGEPLRVYYFFNSNCPSCKKLSPLVDAWEAKMDKSIVLESIPYAPYDEWKWASKAYLVAKEVAPHLKRSEIEKAQEEANILSATDILKAADIVTYATSISRGKIMTTLSSQKMNNAIADADSIAEKYGVHGVPSIVVVGNQEAYRVSPEFGLTKEGIINVSGALVAYQYSKQTQE
ncbi:thioredoxin domain-containing protein [Vibrio coralliirubri]|uniref:thioredoxin domain-containing protein n=1 Tax=Vibrio coralliirubri TaxID=1516159 RepID=UPI00228455B6|nr:thioredoxin domain-containing protein [Vibrio coralliirubri]MCY9865126.1 thioredoxin domain-containing protein [Vibrio coralliirubri]